MDEKLNTREPHQRFLFHIEVVTQTDFENIIILFLTNSGTDIPTLKKELTLEDSVSYFIGTVS